MTVRLFLLLAWLVTTDKVTDKTFFSYFVTSDEIVATIFNNVLYKNKYKLFIVSLSTLCMYD